MSDLQDVCERLMATASSTSRVSAELGGLARQLRSTAARLAASGSVAHPKIGSAIQTLTLAAASCARASDLLAASVQAGRGYVARTVGGDAGGDIGMGAGGVGGIDATPPSRAGLSAAQQVFVDRAVSTPAGAAFFAADDAGLLVGSASVPIFPGEFTVDVHGSPDIVELHNHPPLTLTAADFAGVLRASGWNGAPVRLLGCRTGRHDDGFAQQLADELGVPVTAADTTVWVDDQGGIRLYDAYRRVNPMDQLGPVTLPGHWRRFDPRTPTREDQHL